MTTLKVGKLLMVGMFCLGALMTLVVSLGDAPTLEQMPASGDHSLTASEHAYLAFMLPRLDRLIDEATAVSSLVDDRSRNIVALSGYGNRINVLTTDIMEWDDGNEVPDVFLASHASLLRAAGELHVLIDEAQSALLRFDFTGVGDLIPRFDSAVSTAQTVRDTLPSAANSSS